MQHALGANAGNFLSLAGDAAVKEQGIRNTHRAAKVPVATYDDL
jgi:hypothetical protein